MSKLNVPRDETYERLWLSLKALGGGIWDYDIDADTLYCNDRWCELVGAKPNCVKSVADFRPFIHPDDVDLATNIVVDDVDRMIETGERYQADFRVIRLDGEVRRLRSVACVVRDPVTGHRRAIGCVTDVTDLAVIDQPDAMAGMAENGAEGSGAGAGLLTDRELECLRWVSVGKTAWETAVIMGRSPRTIEFHLGNAMKKLSASNKIHAAVIAVRMGLL